MEDVFFFVSCVGCVDVWLLNLWWIRFYKIILIIVTSILVDEYMENVLSPTP